MTIASAGGLVLLILGALVAAFVVTIIAMLPAIAVYMQQPTVKWGQVPNNRHHYLEGVERFALTCWGWCTMVVFAIAFGTTMATMFAGLAHALITWVVSGFVIALIVSASAHMLRHTSDTIHSLTRPDSVEPSEERS